MTVIAWIAEGTWPACVDAARAYAPQGEDIILLHVSGDDVPGIARGSYAGLLGRRDPGRDPGARVEGLAAASAAELLDAAAGRLGRPCTRLERSGRTEREVVAAAEGAGLLIAGPGRRPRPPRAPEPGRPPGSSSTTPPAPSCWSGPGPRPASGRSRLLRLPARRTAGRAQAGRPSPRRPEADRREAIPRLPPRPGGKGRHRCMLTVPHRGRGASASRSPARGCWPSSPRSDKEPRGGVAHAEPLAAKMGATARMASSRPPMKRTASGPFRGPRSPCRIR